MANLFRRLKVFLDKRDSLHLALIFGMMSFGAALEVVGVGIILPFIALLGGESLAMKNRYLKIAYEWLQPENEKQFLLWALLGMAIFFILKNSILLCSVMMQSSFLKKLHKKFAVRLFKSYLYSPYALTLERNSAQQIRNLGIIGSIVQGLIYPLMTILTEVLVAISVFAFVIWSNPAPSILVGAILVFAIGIFYFLVRKQLGRLGEIQNQYFGRMMQTLTQGLGSAKETRIFGREDYFAREYERDAEIVLDSFRVQNDLVQLPRFYIETVVVTILLGLMAAFFQMGQSPQQVVTSVTIFAIAGLRLMPGLGRISAALNSVRFYTPNLEEVHGDLTHCESLFQISPAEAAPAFRFQDEIQLENIRYRYKNSETDALAGISLSIKKNSLIGFAGASGAGKTTLIDILLGLLTPTQGKVLVDAKNITEDIRGWQRQIGYIPQQVYLLDDSIRSNVAFGLEAGVIDDEKVWLALDLAQLGDFVRHLPRGLDTVVGERGARLSGGQKQRIGIARALYHQPEVLVMDEATAALDNETESLFMDALLSLAGKKTMIFIAHRLTTLKRCDRIFTLNHGKLSTHGTYAQLFESGEKLKDLGLTNLDKQALPS